MTRPTILDLDLVVVPRGADVGMLGAWYRYKNGHRFAGEEPARDTSDVGAYSAMLSASPYPTAWDDVRKYVEGLEKECERLKFLVEWGEAFCDTKHPDTARAEAAEARIAELEKRLADAERVIEPFARLGTMSTHSINEDGTASFSFFRTADMNAFTDARRAARAHMEGK